MTDVQKPQPGWYPESDGRGDQRYWDGANWSEANSDAEKTASFVGTAPDQPNKQDPIVLTADAEIPPAAQRANPPANLPFGLGRSTWPLAAVAVGVGLLLGILAVLIPAMLINTSVSETARITQARVVSLEDQLSDAQADVGALRDKNSSLQREARTAVEELSVRDREVTSREETVQAREDAVKTTEDTIAATSFGDGVHLVGTDLQPGTYRNEGTSSCYWERLSGAGGTLGDIIANDLPSGGAVVSIDAGDYAFSSQRCGTWTLVP